jgi:hypothetical protein
LHLLLAIFSNSLTWSQQTNFGERLGLVYTVYVNKEIDVLTKIPSSFEDLWQFYLDGDSCIQKQSPIPNVTSVNDHSVVAKLRIENKKVEAIFDSKWIIEMTQNGYERVKEEHNDRPIVLLFIMLWSDDFDPTKSIKSNRQSVWIETMTVFTDKKVSLCYVLTVSHKNSECSCWYLLCNEWSARKTIQLKVREWQIKYICKFWEFDWHKTSSIGSSHVNYVAKVFCCRQIQWTNIAHTWNMNGEKVPVKIVVHGYII